MNNFAIPFREMNDAQRQTFVAQLSHNQAAVLPLQEQSSINEMYIYLCDQIFLLERTALLTSQPHTLLSKLDDYQKLRHKLRSIMRKRKSDAGRLKRSQNMQPTFSVSTPKEELLLKLLQHDENEINMCLAIQTISELYAMTILLSKLVTEHQQRLTQLTHLRLRKIGRAHLYDEERLLTIIKRNFTERLTNDSHFNVIKHNANAQLQTRPQPHLIKKIAWSIKRLFQRTPLEDQCVNLYERHLMYTQGLRRVYLEKIGEPAQLLKYAKSYLAEDRYDGVAPNFKRLHKIVADAVILKPSAIAHFELSFENEFYKLVITMHSLEKKAYEIARDEIENYAIEQYKYKSQLLKAITKAKFSLLVLANDYINTRNGRAIVLNLINLETPCDIACCRLTHDSHGYTLSITNKDKTAYLNWPADWVEEHAIAQFVSRKQKRQQKVLHDCQGHI